MPSAVPYETLVRFGAVQRRINDLADELYALDSRLGRWIGDQLGHGLPDHAYEEYDDAIEAAIEKGADG